MSLINEALKKAQRQRTEDTADPTAAAPLAGAPVVRRGKPTSTNTMVLIGSGALVLIVLSVVFTVYLVNRPTSSAKVAVSSTAPEAKKTAPAPVGAEPATPPIVVPKITPPVIPTSEPRMSTASPSAPVATAPATSGSTPTTAPAPLIVPPTVTPVSSPPATEPIARAQPPSATSSSAVPAVASTPAAGSTPAAQTPSAPPPGSNAPDERVTAFVEAVRVTGIRSSGAESRVLMNERVYRVNDIVERNLNIRLIKAAADSLTFSDPRGVIYEKRF